MKLPVISKLIKFMHKKDFGHDYYVQILNIKKWSLFQASISWNDYGGFPYLQVTMGSNGLLGFLFCLGKFGVDFDILSRTYNFDYYKKEDVQ